MKEVFIRVRELLKEIPELKFIDLDKGQLEFYETRPAVAFPCALIKLDVPRAEDRGGKIQHCNCTATVRLAFDYTGETSGVAPDAALTSALAYFDLIDLVYAKLQGNGNNKMAPFTRRNMREENRRDGLKVISIPFETEYDDLTAAV